LLTITSKDQATNTTNALANIVVNSLSAGGGSGQFYAAADTTCVGGTTTSVTILSGTNNITLRYKNNVAETRTLTVDDGVGGVDPGTLSFQTGPDRIILSGASPIRSGDCTAYTVTPRDVAGNTTNALSTVTVNLTKSGGSGAFYSNAACTIATSTATITSGTSSGTFYFVNNVGETQTLTVADNNAAYLTGSNLSVTTGPRYYQLTGLTPSRAGECGLYTITTKDSSGNTNNATAAPS
jgi:hypothetical protein